LRSIDRERGDHHGAPAFRRAVDNVSEFIRDGAGRMIAIAVRRFAEQKIRTRGRLGIFQYGLIVAPNVP
jgi:hypothetical protein